MIAKSGKKRIMYSSYHFYSHHLSVAKDFLYIEVFQVINVERMIKLDYYNYVTTNEKKDNSC